MVRQQCAGLLKPHKNRSHMALSVVTGRDVLASDHSFTRPVVPVAFDRRLNDATVNALVEKPNDLMAAGNELVQKFLNAGLKRLKNKPN